MELHPLALINQIARDIRRFLETGLGDHDLTFNQYNLLQLLIERDVWLPSELAERMSIDRPTVAVILRNLERKGWIHRKTDPENRRNVHVRITEAGHDKAEGARQWMIRVKGSFDPLVGLSETDLEVLVTKLETIRRNVSEHLTELPSRLSKDD